jgi:hypothetical protein
MRASQLRPLVHFLSQLPTLLVIFLAAFGSTNPCYDQFPAIYLMYQSCVDSSSVIREFVE